MDQLGFRGIDSMPNAQIEEFAQKFMIAVRDAAIHQCDLRIDASAPTTPVSRRWKKAINTSVEELARILIADCIDSACAALFRAIDQGLLPLDYKTDAGEKISLEDAGMGGLCGSYLGAEGWRRRYSEERMNRFDQE